MEKNLIHAFELLDKVKDACRTSITQCTFINPMASSGPMVRSCMETIDSVELLKLFIINKSPNTKVGIDLVIKVLNLNMKLAKEGSKIEGCEKMLTYLVKINNETINYLKELNKKIK